MVEEEKYKKAKELVKQYEEENPQKDFIVTMTYVYNYRVTARTEEEAKTLAYIEEIGGKCARPDDFEYDVEELKKQGYLLEE